VTAPSWQGSRQAVFRREEDHWVLAGNFAGEQRVRAEPFEAVELELEALWHPTA
jgi:hypothetical protein